MCEKVETLFEPRMKQQLKQQQMADLFAQVQKGGVSVLFAAKQLDLSPKEFKARIQMNGFKVRRGGNRRASA